MAMCNVPRKGWQAGKSYFKSVTQKEELISHDSVGSRGEYISRRWAPSPQVAPYSVAHRGPSDPS